MAEHPHPEPVTVTRWRCPFCRRSRSSKQATAEHIARCWRNPAVRSCKSCVNLIIEPDGGDCIPGEPCTCNEGRIECRAGAVMEAGGEPVTNCPAWAPREANRG